MSLQDCLNQACSEKSAHRSIVELNRALFEPIKRNGARSGNYVESIRLNGKSINQVWFRHADIADGGTLDLTMGDTPNTSLGAAADSLPPASIPVHPEDFNQR